MTGHVRAPEREITEPVDMCLPNGRLNPAAIGWSRRPLHRANLKGWGRNKRFEYWCITTPEIVVAVNVSHSDYRVTLATFFLDIASRQGFPMAEVHWLPRSRVDSMPEISGTGPVEGRGDAMRIRMLPTPTGTRLEATNARLTVELDVTEPPGHESMGVLVPWDDKRFQYTRKDNCLPVSGRVVADGREYRVDPATAYATLDHGRGRWPYHIVWNWAAGSGRSRGEEIGLQFGSKWTDGTPSTENALRLGGRIEKISHDLVWTYDTSDWLAPWTIKGDRVDLVFTPIYDRVADFDWWLVCSKEHQVFGWFDGEVVSETGRRYPVERVFGWAEEVMRKW